MNQPYSHIPPELEFTPAERAATAKAFGVSVDAFGSNPPSLCVTPKGNLKFQPLMLEWLAELIDLERHPECAHCAHKRSMEDRVVDPRLITDVSFPTAQVPAGRTGFGLFFINSVVPAEIQSREISVARIILKDGSDYCLLATKEALDKARRIGTEMLDAADRRKLAAQGKAAASSQVHGRQPDGQ
jgi:hypothetical protein